MSKLEIINRIIQVFFIRLAWCKGDSGNGYKIIYWIVPFTGWKAGFKVLGKIKFYSIPCISHKTPN